MAKSDYQDKAFYSTKELAEKFGVTPELVRDWDNRFQIIPKVKRQGGHRRFSKQQAVFFGKIYHLVKERKMSIGGAMKYLKQNSSGRDRRLDAIAELREIRKRLEELRSIL